LITRPRPIDPRRRWWRYPGHPERFHRGANTAFLSHFEIVSDASMLSGTLASGWVGIGGFQEPIVITPEPRAVAGMLAGILVIGMLVLRRRRSVNPTV
jgi:hypothetical protein